MAILAFLLSAFLIVAGFGALIASLSLLPTEMGELYAVCGVIAISSGFIVLAIAALIVRIDGLVVPPREAGVEPASARVDPAFDPNAPIDTGPASQGPRTVGEAAEEDEVNANRSGHLPSLRAIEEAIAHPEPRPEVVGHYKAGGASYMVFADGAIEAETDEGAFRFASLGEFTSYIANRTR